jgi:plastocyanin
MTINDYRATDRKHVAAGLLTLLAAVVLGAGVVFGMTAGVGAIWTSVTSSGGGAAGGAPIQAAPAAPASASPGAEAPSAAASTVHKVTLSVNPQPLGGVKAPDGKVHDAFVPAAFTMKVGQTYKVTVLNYDDMPHTWTSDSLGVNVNISPGTDSSPSRTTFTIHPTKAGSFLWYCATPCDSWAMAHDGYMRGHVTVVA